MPIWFGEMLGEGVMQIFHNVDLEGTAEPACLSSPSLHKINQSSWGLWEIQHLTQ